MEIQKLVKTVFDDSRFIKLTSDMERYHEVRLKSMIITYLIMVRTDKYVLELASHLLPLIISEHELRVQNLDPVIVEFIYTRFSEMNPGEMIINNYLMKGYYFHSFNGIFKDSIACNGLNFDKKSWNADEFSKVRNIFLKYGKKDIFGMYIAEKRTPIFLAPHLTSSARYGLGSPEWFQHFTSGGMYAPHNEYNRLAFRNRDYHTCLSNVMRMCKDLGLTAEELKVVLDFFDYHYAEFTACDYPCVALMEKEKIEVVTDKLIEREENETEMDYVNRLLILYNSFNRTVRKNIDKDDIIIIEFKTKEKEINL